MRLDIYTLIIICVCVGTGYLVFTLSYLDDTQLQTSIFTLQLDDNIKFYEFLGGNHTEFTISRKFLENQEMYKVEIHNGQPLSLAFLANGDELRPFNLQLKSLDDERFLMYVHMIAKELIIFSIGLIGIIFVKESLREKEKKKNFTEVLHTKEEQERFEKCKHDAGTITVGSRELCAICKYDWSNCTREW